VSDDNNMTAPLAPAVADGVADLIALLVDAAAVDQHLAALRARIATANEAAAAVDAARAHFDRVAEERNEALEAERQQMTEADERRKFNAEYEELNARVAAMDALQESWRRFGEDTLGGLRMPLASAYQKAFCSMHQDASLFKPLADPHYDGEPAKEAGASVGATTESWGGDELQGGLTRTVMRPANPQDDLPPLPHHQRFPQLSAPARRTRRIAAEPRLGR
jgi:hypothetical protein